MVVQFTSFVQGGYKIHFFVTLQTKDSAMDTFYKFPTFLEHIQERILLVATDKQTLNSSVSCVHIEEIWNIFCLSY